MKQNPFERLKAIIAEIERLDRESPAPEGESNPLIEPLIEEANTIIRRLNPVVREAMRDKPEALAQWESILKDYPDLLVPDEADTAQQEAEAAKEAEGLKLAAEMRAVIERITAEVARFSPLDGPNLELEGALERCFAALHELDIEMRLRCRSFPEELENWKAAMEEFAEMEARFERGRELQESEPAN